MRRPSRIAASVVAWLTFAAVVFTAWQITELRTEKRDPVRVERMTIVELQGDTSQVKFEATVECGQAGTVTICTVCGIDYEGNPINGETVAECKRRHLAKIAEVEEACE